MHQNLTTMPYLANLNDDQRDDFRARLANAEKWKDAPSGGFDAYLPDVFRMQEAGWPRARDVSAEPCTYDAYLAAKFGSVAVREQRQVNEKENAKIQRRESRKSVNAARREALKDARKNPPRNFRMVFNGDYAPTLKKDQNAYDRRLEEAEKLGLDFSLRFTSEDNRQAA